MSILVISLPPRPRLRSRSAEPLAVEASGSDEFDYLLSSDGFSVQAQGRCAPSLLPKADSVVAVVCDADIAWHRITLPKAPAARLRAALTGLLEDAVLEDTESTHFALAPGSIAGQPTWVAAIHRPWLAGVLASLERREVFVDRVVPLSWPDDRPSGHFSETIGTTTQQDLMLTWAHSDGVVMLRLQGGLARSLLPQPLPPEARWSSTPEVATAAERWLGAPVSVASAGERALLATRTLWNLRQFDLARRNRGTRAVRDLLRRWSSPVWRPVRYGLVTLVAAQVIGLNLWAWHQSTEVASKRKAMVSLVQSSFPQIRAVLDAPLQMQREVDTLRALAGKPSEADLEPQLQAAAAAWPIGQPPVTSLSFQPGRLTLVAAGWSEAETDRFRSQLLPAGWQVEASQGRLVLTRAGQSPR
jgi:general secretion pathway protein L